MTKPSPLLKTPKPSIGGKSKRSDPNSVESKIVSKSSVSSLDSSESPSPQIKKIVVRSLSSEFGEDLLDQELSFENQALDDPISFEAFDSPAISSLTVEDEVAAAVESAGSNEKMKVMKKKVLDLCSDPVFLARFQIGLTLVLVSLVAVLDILVVVSMVGSGGDEGSFSDLPPPT